MKLRTQISLFLFLFGLVPLFAAILINVPLIFDRIELLYHKAYLQNLRAGFSDLDQHVARRHETVRLLAKFPEPGMLPVGGGRPAASDLKGARSRYLEWLNQLLLDQLDVVRILFLDKDGNVQHWLEKSLASGKLEPQNDMVAYSNPQFVEAGMQLQPGMVLNGPIVFSREAGEDSPHKFMQLGLISPVYAAAVPEAGGVGSKQGLVIVYLDIGGLVDAYPGVFWVQNDGSYLVQDEPVASAFSAFDDYPGLGDIFSKGELALWEKDEQQVLWVPLFITEDAGPLWVGRSVDPSPIATLRHAIEIRVVTIVLGLLIFVFIVARLIALRTERLGRELTDGISRVMERDEPVNFTWRRPEELHALGDNLTRLSLTHSENSKALRDYARELEESNKYKSEFLANVSHELRTPLNSILLLSKMLADHSRERQPEEDLKQARVIHAAGNDLRALIDNILDLSRIEARQMSLHPERTSLYSLLDDIQQLLKPQYEEKGLTLTIEIDRDAPDYIETDREKLRQILINFLSNAVKFTTHGGARIRLQEYAGPSAGEYAVCISVIDTGIGIPDSKQRVIFEAFKQADGSTSRRFGGTGLGLTISRDLAHLMGGDIRLESQPGQGATFSVLLPEHMPSVAGEGVRPVLAAEAGTGEQQATLPEANYTGARALLVDDDMRNLLALTPVLEHWGIQVMAAGEGREALETLETEGDFDIVLLDIMMPGLDGYEVTREIRSKPAYTDLPVIALTARAGEEDLRDCLAAGANDHLVKPIELEELKILLDKYLSGTGRRAVPGEHSGGGL
jgi:signal transduction histidine kinase/CheY-like chemotaxis protein